MRDLRRRGIIVKKSISIVLPSDVIIFSFIDSGAFNSLNEEYQINYIVSPMVKKPLQGRCTIISLSTKFNILNKYLGNLFWYTSLFEYHRLRKLAFQQSFKIMQQPPVWRLVYKILSFPPFNKVIKWLDESVFFFDDPLIEKYLKSTQPQLLIFPGSAMDSYSHIVARTANKCKIPSLMLISHWDFFSKKSVMRFAPTKIYVWGEDMKKMALLDRATNKNSIEVVGSPNLDKYRYLVAQDDSIFRSKLGIPLSAKIILFAGTSVPYDEVSALQRINFYLEKNDIQDTYIIYRPHPRGWMRKSKATAQPSNMQFVKIDQPESKNSTTQDHYMQLLSAVDGIVSPFSTMILEGALCGKNVLCISFADSINEFDFSITNTTDHLQNIRNKSWAIVCDSSENFEEDFANLIKKIANRKLTNFDIKDIIYYDEKPYPDRLLLRIKKDFSL